MKMLRSSQESAYKSKAKLVLAFFVLAAQVGGIAYARVSEKRYFCWAPNDYVTDYKLKVVANGRELSDAEVQARYRLPGPFGVYENPASHIKTVIQQYETTYGKGDHATAELTWRLNATGAARRWSWPAEHN